MRVYAQLAAQDGSQLVSWGVHTAGLPLGSNPLGRQRDFNVQARFREGRREEGSGPAGFGGTMSPASSAAADGRRLLGAPPGFKRSYPAPRGFRPVSGRRAI